MSFGMAHLTSGRNGGGFSYQPTPFSANTSGFSVQPTMGATPIASFMINTTSGRMNNGFTPTVFNSPPQVIHEGVNCDGCGQAPLQGIRYKCSSCPNFDLCSRCIERVENNRAENVRGNVQVPLLHDPQHFFLRIAESLPSNANQLPTYLQNRSTMIHHNSRGCQGCGLHQFAGFQFYCQQCNISLCEACELKDAHGTAHPLMKLRPEHGSF